ncbi:hypothetical protein Tco_0652342 [Tanacetum coccineum]|uniref:Uncharacterized protein n=1 Tax=Tanacetum coccineum TaxID=301880 RepID=A0ABQ4WXK2_9ASTR
MERDFLSQKGSGEWRGVKEKLVSMEDKSGEVSKHVNVALGSNSATRTPNVLNSGLESFPTVYEAHGIHSPGSMNEEFMNHAGTKVGPTLNGNTPGMSSYTNVTGVPSRNALNFCTLFTPAGNGVDVVVPVESVRAISERFANTAYGFFLGKRVAYPVIANYVRNTWGKYVVGIIQSPSNIRRIQVKEIIKEVEDYLKTYSSAGMDISWVDTVPLTNDHINIMSTTNVSQSVIDENLPQLLDSRGGSHVTNVLAFDKEDFTSWKVRFLVFLDGLEPYLIKTLEDGPFIRMSSLSTSENPLPKRQNQWKNAESRLANQDKRLKSIIIYCLPNDVMKFVIKCKTAKEIWTDLMLAHEGPSDTRDTKISALRLKFNAFKSLEGEKNGTFTRLKCLLNDLENNGVCIPQAEVNATLDSDSDVEEDQRTINEFMADLNAEYHERALLANQKRFYKRNGRVGSARKPLDKSKETCFF